MNYEIVFKPKSVADFKSLPQPDIERILQGIERLKNNLTGDVKRLTHFFPEYRLRIGHYRVLFEISEQTIIVYRILHRQAAYRRKSS